MVARHQIAEILDRSLFSHLDSIAVEQLCAVAEIRRFNAGDLISKSQKPSQLVIVVSGEVLLVDNLDRTQQRGRVLSGRALELKALLSGADEWSFDWVAESNAELIFLPWSSMSQVLAQKPVLNKYLSNVAQFPELQRLKNDLRLYGFSFQEIQATLSSLEKIPLEGVLKFEEAAETQAGLMIVHKGIVTVSSEIMDEKKVLAEFAAGDYFSTPKSNEKLEWSGNTGTECWSLTEKVWRQAVEAGKIEKFLLMIDPVSKQLAETENAAQTTTVEEIEPEEDDGLTVQDFQIAPDEQSKIYRKKFVHIKQQDQMDCGAACLAIVSKFYGRRINIPAFRSLVHVTRDGASMLSLKKAAEKVGMQSIGVMSGVKALQKMRTPFIALMQYHFIVVFKVTNTEVVVADPGRNSLYSLKPDEFKAEYSQNALLLKTTPAFFKYPETASTFGKYALVFKGVGPILLDIALVSSVIFLLGLTAPVFMQYLFDNVLANKQKGILHALAVGMILLNLISGVSEWVRGYLLSHLTSNIDAKFSSLFMKHTMSLPMNFFAVRSVGDITTRVEELAKIRDFFTGRTISMLIGAASILIYSFIMGMYSLKLLGLIFILLPLVVGFVAFMIPKITENMQETYKASAKNSSMIFEQFSGLDSIKSLGATLVARWRWEETFLKTLALRKRLERINGWIAGGAELFQEGINIAVLLAAVYLYINNELSLGQVVAVSTLVSSIVRPAIQIVSDWNQFNQVGVSLARVDDIITSAVEPDPVKSPHVGMEFKGDIEFRNITFQYGSEMSPIVLDNVSLTIKAGETVALVGRSGSGKSTLGYMVNLLYAPTKGNVFIDGVDATHIPLATLRRQIAMIMQDNSLFSGTVLENITVGDPHPSFRRAMDAARSADAHDFIAKMKNGYSSSLGEGGGGLSGGQKQRLNIARALYLNPNILIMDEATSALDAVSEEAVVNSIRSSKNKRTTIIIAHRLNTIMYADKIVVLDQGKIIEMGSHSELLARRGFYYELFRKQLNY